MFFNKLFGRRKKKFLAAPHDLSLSGKRTLKQFGFSLTESSDNNMWKYYEWANSDFQFSLTYDRGYYDSDVCPLNAGSQFRMSLIPLLKYLRNDKLFYNKELKEANLWNTLTPDGYIVLLANNYDLIKKFARSFDTNKFENYKKFDFDYDGI